ILVLSFIGIFIAGTLSLGKFLNAIPPCGAGSSGCLKVETDPSSNWGPIPVAYVGLLAYITFAGLAIIRQQKGLVGTRMLVNLGY
ncbi:vitamin K epoxide reductase family protein, partial [Acinetobacter baumannii]